MTIIEKNVRRSYKHWKLILKYITPTGKTHSVVALRRTDEVTTRKGAERELSLLMRRAKEGKLLPSDQETVDIPKVTRAKVEKQNARKHFRNEEGYEFRGRGPRSKKGFRWFAVFYNGKQIKHDGKLLKIRATTPGHASVIFEIEYV